MEPPPAEHHWAYNFESDAGEMVLVRAIDAPELIIDTHPSKPEFMDLLEEAMNRPKDRNYGDGDVWEWKGQKVFALPNYDDKTLDLAVTNGDSWSYKVIGKIRSMEEYKRFENEAEMIEDKGYLDYLFEDMGWLKNDPKTIPQYSS